MALCLGARAVCETNKGLWIPLQAIGRHPERAFFISTTPLLLPSLTQVTLMRLSSAGEWVDSRELKFFAK
jgi:hypothetical protein